MTKFGCGGCRTRVSGNCNGTVSQHRKTYGETRASCQALCEQYPNNGTTGCVGLNFESSTGHCGLHTYKSTPLSPAPAGFSWSDDGMYGIVGTPITCVQGLSGYECWQQVNTHAHTQRHSDTHTPTN